MVVIPLGALAVIAFGKLKYNIMIFCPKTRVEKMFQYNTVYAVVTILLQLVTDNFFRFDTSSLLVSKFEV